MPLVGYCMHQLHTRIEAECGTQYVAKTNNIFRVTTGRLPQLSHPLLPRATQPRPHERSLNSAPQLWTDATQPRVAPPPRHHACIPVCPFPLKVAQPNVQRPIDFQRWHGAESRCNWMRRWRDRIKLCHSALKTTQIASEWQLDAPHRPPKTSVKTEPTQPTVQYI